MEYKTCPHCEQQKIINAKHCRNCGYPFWYATLFPLFRQQTQAWRIWIGILVGVLFMPFLPFIYLDDPLKANPLIRLLYVY